MRIIEDLKQISIEVLLLAISTSCLAGATAVVTNAAAYDFNKGFYDSPALCSNAKNNLMRINKLKKQEGEWGHILVGNYGGEAALKRFLKNYCEDS